MTTIDERREIAAKLRALPNLATMGDLAECVFGRKCTWSAAGLADEIADLIESCKNVKCLAEIKIDGEQLEDLVHKAAIEYAGVDRDVLLALADEMRRNTLGMLSDDHVDASAVWYYEYLLRKAVGA